MPFLSALSSGNYDSLRGTSVIPPTYASAQYLCLGANATAMAARVNQASFALSFVSITFDTVTTGAYTDVLEGMTVLISHTNDKRAAYFVGRVRAGTTSTILKVNETSAVISDNDYVFVLNDHRMYHKLGRESGGVYYKDYALTFSALKPIIYGLQSAYAGIVSGSPAGYTVAFSASATAATYGATITGYAWTIPSGGTVTAGSISTASVTVRFDASASEYWVKLVVTDSGGRTQTRHIPVFAVPADLSTTVALGFKGANITCDIDNGWSATVEAFDDVDSVLDNTLAVIFNVEYYNGTATNLNGNVEFVGRLRKETNRSETDDTYGLISSSSFELESVASQLARISAPYITTQDSASAAAWDQITHLTVWRAITYMLEHSTFHELHSLSFGDLTETYRAYQLEVDQGNQFDSVKSLAQAINAVIEFTPAGEARINRDARYLATASRNALTTVATFTTNDATAWTIERDHVETVGLVEASGGTYAVSSMGIQGAAVTLLLSIAPGTAQGNADGTTTLTRQILGADFAKIPAQTELNTRTGNHYAKENDEVTLAVDMLDGYHFLIPSVSQWYKWEIAASENTRGIAYTTSVRWLLKSIDVTHDNETGTKAVNAVFTIETEGTPGQTQNYPPTGNTPSPLPDIPSIPAYPEFPPLPPIYLPGTPTPDTIPPYSTTPTPVPIDGNAVVYWSTAHIWFVRNFLGANTPFDITPETVLGTIRDFALVGRGGYLLSSDGTDSTVYYNTDVFNVASTWTDSGMISGEYVSVRPTSTTGALYILANGTSSVTTTYDFAISDYGFTVSAYSATYTAGVGWETGAGAGGQVVYISKTISSTVVTSATLEWVFNVGAPNPNGFIKYGAVNDTFVGSSPHTITQTDTTTTFDLAIGNGGGSSPTGTLTGFSFTSPASSAVDTRYSSDFGATFGSPVSVGTAIGNVGIDTERIGVPVLAGYDGQVRIATSAGGAYSDYGSATPTGTQPFALAIPRYQFGSTTTGNVSTTTPQYLLGSNTLGSSNKALLKVTSSGTTFTDITPSSGGDYGLSISPRSLAIPWRSGSRIAAVLRFGSLPRLVTSTNAGTSWSDRGVLDVNANMCTFRKGDVAMQQIYLTNGGPAYSPNYGASIVTKSYPADTSEPLIGIAVYG